MKLKQFVVGIAGIALLGFVGCNKEEEDPTVAEIHVVDVEGKIVPYAQVELTCESSTTPPEPCIIETGGTTDAAGMYSTEFELPNVLRVTAYKIHSDTQIFGILPDTTMIITTDSICGESFISVLENQTNRKTVVLYECN
jgi:hypothetical protein